MFTYYKELPETSIHYLYAGEVAQVLYNFGLATVEGKPASRLVAALLGARDGSARLFYNTSHGLRRVYVSSLDFLQEVQDGNAFFQGADKRSGEVYTVKIGNKNYKYRLL